MSHYQLFADTPLSEFDESVVNMLEDLHENGTPKALVAVVMMESGEVATFYHQAELKDLMTAKGFIDLDIMTDHTLGNLPFYLEQAEKEGLLEYTDEDEGEDEDD